MGVSIQLILHRYLAVEVVSPGKENRDRDYRYKRCSAVLGVSPMSDCIKKRSEYAARGIKYYWIIDPLDKKFVSLELKDGLYEEKIYDNSQAAIYFQLPFELEIKLERIFFEN